METLELEPTETLALPDEGEPLSPEIEAALCAHYLPESKIAFSVTDESSAAWVMEKLLELDAREERLKAGFAAAKDEIERERRFFKKRFGAQLEQFTAYELDARGGKKKSFALLTGVVGFRSTKELMEIEDKEAALQWAEKHAPAAIKQTPSLLKAELLAAAKKHGVWPDGCKYVAAGEKFFAVPPK